MKLVGSLIVGQSQTFREYNFTLARIVGGAAEQTIILTAFGFKQDDGSWGGEIGPFMEAMGESAVDVSTSLPFCQQAYEGQIHGQEAVRPATAWYKNCAETTGDNFWHSTVDDAHARELAARALNEAYGTDLTAGDVIAVTAMEQTGWMNVLEDWMEITGYYLPMAYSRSSFNFDHPWRLADGSPAVDPATSIEEGMQQGGSTLGVVTAALPVLKEVVDLACRRSQSGRRW